MKVKEVFETIQGEGYWAGRAAVFVRFAGCNLWSGREEDRKTAKCDFCDTDFLGGETLSEDALLERMLAFRPRFVVFTGGEPTLQLTREFIQKVKAAGFYCAIETNGTLDCPIGLDWICVSPKTLRVAQFSANEVKVVWPQRLVKSPELWKNRIKADHYWVSPMDGCAGSTETCVEFVKANPDWRLSLQTHKFIAVP